jgi:Zn-dependent protease/CBS domain-containing protein
MKSSFKLFRIAGIDIGIHYSWIFIFALITWSLAEGVFRPNLHNPSTAEVWLLGVLAALLLFICVLLHELAHSLVARARGMAVSSITLFILGGVSNLEEEPQQPAIEFYMAIVGPLTSIVLGGIFFALSRLAANGTAPREVLNYLWYVNLLLGIFNLVPGFPLDGGRVLRSLLWSATGSLVKATNAAAMVGRLIGWAMIIIGFFGILGVSIFGRDLGFLGGIWLAFIGWFLSSTADASRRQVMLNELLAGKKVRDIMGTRPETVTSDKSVEQLVSDIFNQKHGRAVPVCDGGHLSGIVTITDVKKVLRDRWTTTRVGDIMTKSPLYKVSPDDAVSKALELISRHDINQLLIEYNDSCAGMLSRADILRYIQLLQDLGQDRTSGAGNDRIGRAG